MAFEFILICGLVAAAALVLVLGRAAMRHARRADRLDTELETLRDVLWVAEDRVVSAEADAQAGAAADSQAKSQFLATVTHEMRTPLSGVIGTAELLLETNLAPDQRTYARAILSSAAAMLGLVDEILDHSRMAAEKPALEAAPFAIADLVEGVAELLAPRAQAKGLDLAVTIARDAPTEVRADAGRVRQILLNLAGNAIKFTAAGGVGLRVERDGDRVLFRVVDTGPGFDPADAGKLFEEFERAAADPAVAGVGLGLAISRRLAEAMAGTIVAEGRPGAGATFTLALPAGSRPAAALVEHPLAGRRVAVVSAAPFSGPWLAEKLGDLGAEAWLAEPDATPDELTAFVREKRADLVVVDRAADARDLAAAARRGGAIRAVLLLAPAERGDLDRLAEDGFDGYLVKPVRSASLVSRIEDPRGSGGVRVGAPEGAVVFPARGGLRVLVAEDDPVSALIALAHLARLGHSSTHVADGRSACEAFEREAFDAVLLDLRMPLLDGCSAARRMRAAEAAAGRPRTILVALTANGGAAERAEALAAGMDDLLAKPLDRRALEALLEPIPGIGAKVA